MSDLLLHAGGWDYYRYGGGKTTAATTLSLSGDSTVFTPGVSQMVTLYWVGMSSPSSNSADVVVTVKLGGTVVYLWDMAAPGAFSHWEPVTGALGAALVVNLSGAQTVQFNYTYTVG